MKIKAKGSNDFFNWEKNRDPKCGSGMWHGRGWRGQAGPRDPIKVSSWGILADDEVG